MVPAPTTWTRPAPRWAAAWHGSDHLFAAGEYEAAGEIVTAVYDILARWGERDRAKALLRGSIDTLEGGNKAVAQGNLATLLKDEGKLAEALATYEAGLPDVRGGGRQAADGGGAEPNGLCLSGPGQLRQSHRIRRNAAWP